MELLRDLTVLVVEDDIDARELLTMTLASYGAKVHAADGADAARGLLATQQPDVLVSDISMPGEDGYSLIRSIRELEQVDHCRLPAIALTALHDARSTMRVRSWVRQSPSEASQSSDVGQPRATARCRGRNRFARALSPVGDPLGRQR